jgi:hypothetical protein
VRADSCADYEKAKAECLTVNALGFDCRLEMLQYSCLEEKRMLNRASPPSETQGQINISSVPQNVGTARGSTVPQSSGTSGGSIDSWCKYTCGDMYRNYSLISWELEMLPACESKLENECMGAQNCTVNCNDLKISLMPENWPNNGYNQNSPYYYPACIEKLEQSCMGSSNNPSKDTNISTERPSTDNPYFATLEQLTTKCESDSGQIQSACTETPSDMTSTLRVITDQSTQMISASTLDACSKLAQNSSAVQSALSSVKIACGGYYDSCRSSCQQAKNELNRLNSNPPQSTSSNLGGLSSGGLTKESWDASLVQYRARIKSGTDQCQAAQGHLRTLNQNLTNITAQMEKSSQCAAQLSADGKAPPTYDQCIRDPKIKGCEFFKDIANMNCNNPDFASKNVTCICAKNPNAPQCGGLNQKPIANLNPDGGMSSGSKGTDVTSGSNSDSPFGTGSFGGSNMDFPESSGNLNQASNPRGGSSGGGFAGGLGVGSMGRPLNEPFQKNRPEIPSSKLNPNIIGRSGGGGGFLGAIKSALGIGRNGYTRDSVTEAYNKEDNKDKGSGFPDLRQFLPGGLKDPRRAVSSSAGPDGLTGPFTDNFKKINVRYISLSHSFQTK